MVNLKNIYNIIEKIYFIASEKYVIVSFSKKVKNNKYNLGFHKTELVNLKVNVISKKLIN